MTKNNEVKTELLSPAGDFDALKAAVRCGADAVYIGGKAMSARRFAKNFSTEEIASAAAYCRERGVRLYLALNTLIRPDEEPAAAKAVESAARCGVDALIVQDIGLAKTAKNICPDLPLHASTQLTAHSTEDVRALMSLGFSRIVLSRELNGAEIKKIYLETGCEIEAFVHGALCVCFSGRCLMSSFIGGRSGNRGCCAQPCRRLYFGEGKSGYFLSTRDLSLVRRLDEMKAAGVMSFKIEGRMKSPEYVAVVTDIYRRALDGQPLTKRDYADLRSIFSRGGELTEGWFAGENAPEMMNYSVPNDNISASVPRELLSRARENFLRGDERPRIGVDIRLSVRGGKPVLLEAADSDGNTAAAAGEAPLRAEKAPLTAEKAAERLKKTGGTPYYISSFSSDIGENLFIPAAELNALRRACFEELGKKRRKAPEREIRVCHPSAAVSAPKREKPRLFAEITDLNQLKAAEAADKVIIPLRFFDEIPFKGNYAAMLPQIILDSDAVRRRLSRLPKEAEVYSSSLGGLRLINEAGLRAAGDFGLNISNVAGADCIADSVSSLTLSPELNLKEITDICSGSSVPIEIIGYGRQTVMLSRVCLIRGVRGKCDCGSPLMLKDATGAEFPIMGDRETHLNTVLNSRPTFIADRLERLKSCGLAAVRLCFTLEDAAEVAEIIRLYRTGGKPSGEFTRGYFFKNYAIKKFN